MKIKNLENLPNFEPTSPTKQHGWNANKYWRKSLYWTKIHKLLDGHVGKEFNIFYHKAKLLLPRESNPMNFILKHWFRERSEYSIIDGIITKNTNIPQLPNKAMFENNKYYLITDNSVVGSVLHIHTDRHGNKFISKSKWSSYGEQMAYDRFIEVFVKGIKGFSRRHYTYGITRIEAEYYLNPERFEYKTYQGLLIDLTKCIKFNDKKSLIKYLRRQSWENRKKIAKIKRLAEQAKLEQAKNLLGEAMQKYQQRAERNKQQQILKAKIEAEKSAAIRDRHGFDETSFTTQQNRIK